MRTYIRLHRKHLQQNLNQFFQITEKKIMFAVKGNAYGHGLKEIVETAKSHPQLGYFVVDSLDEALIVRRQSDSIPILLIGWSDDQELQDALEQKLEIIVHSLDSWRMVKEISRRCKLPARIHLKIETGTARLGLDPEDALKIAQARLPHKNKIVGIYSHFANIEDTSDHSYANRQMQIYRRFLDQAQLPEIIHHFSCSASALLFPETYFDMVRIGISAYGYWPSKQTFLSYREQKGPPITLKPVLEWITHIAQIRTLPKGTPVGYGLSYKTLHRTRIAVLPVGYYDGYDRGLSNLGQVLIDGEAAPIRGRICMNMMMVDVTHIPTAKTGTPVILIGRSGGEKIWADDLAEKVHSIQYEILSRINPLLPRVVDD